MLWFQTLSLEQGVLNIGSLIILRFKHKSPAGCCLSLFFSLVVVYELYSYWNAFVMKDLGRLGRLQFCVYVVDSLRCKHHLWCTWCYSLRLLLYKISAVWLFCDILIHLFVALFPTLFPYEMIILTSSFWMITHQWLITFMTDQWWPPPILFDGVLGPSVRFLICVLFVTASPLSVI